MSENLRIALISAAAAIVGTLAGGTATYLATVQASKSEDRRQERRVEQEVRGSARYLITEFLSAASYMGAMEAGGRHYRTQGTPFDIVMEPGDMQRVFARLSPQELGVVYGGLELNRSYARLTTGFKDDTPLDAAGQTIVSTAHGAFEDAADDLRRVAGINGRPWKRSTRRLPRGYVDPRAAEALGGN